MSGDYIDGKWVGEKPKRVFGCAEVRKPAFELGQEFFEISLELDAYVEALVVLHRHEPRSRKVCQIPASHVEHKNARQMLVLFAFQISVEFVHVGHDIGEQGIL